MFKRFVVTGAIILVGVAAYVYFARDTGTSFDVDIPETTFEEVMEIDSSPEELIEEELEEGEEEVPEEEEDTEVEESELTDSEEGFDIPEEFNLAVAFTSQAPHHNWDLPYQEACEEASAYMVSLYYDGHPSGKVDPDVADAALLDVVDFQTDLYGFYLDTTAVETQRFMMEYFNVGAEVVHNPTVDQIKNEIANGRPVIVPASGRELGNPNFTGLGPLYHMFVIKGYTEDKFITNDPGTRNGENFVYDIDVVMSAMGDWNNGDPANGDKVVIFTHR